MSVLPDEIISEILSPALKVSDELFSDTSDVSPFAKYSPSTSAYLVVCRDWLRVATPYSTMWSFFRSRSQANALEKVLETHKEFGRFIKKLRVEGGYGIAMHTILKCAPNITDIFLSLAILGYVRTPLINPRRVILNQNLTALTKVILACIVKWTTWYPFIIFAFPTLNRDYTEGAGQNLAEALSGSPTVHTVLFGELRGLSDSLLSLSKVPTIQVLQLKVQLPAHIRRVFDDDTRLKSLVRYPEMPDPKPEGSAQIPDIAPSLNPSFIPMESASEETREIVWKRVLFFAMYVEELRCPSFSRRPSDDWLFPTYMTVECNQLGAYAMVRQLQNRPELGSFIRFIFINRYLTPDTLPAIFHFQVLANATGSSLRECSVRLSQGSIHASSLARFQELRVLELSGYSYVNSESMPENLGLSKLETLRVSHLGFDDSFLRFFTMIRKVSLSVLESLHTVRFEHVPNYELFGNFLSTHGSRLRHLAFPFSSGMAAFKLFDVCKQLLDIEFIRLSPPPQDFTCETPHGSLVKIIMDDNDLGDPDEFDLTSFPALREIQIRHWKWPTTERAISKSERIPVAEAWLKHGIQVTDSAEQHWIPRVKRSRKR
ncbi:hypothetical protein B0H13DRAFT_1988542 [Mycena leptocephala]|nr:hypothetical protein B0H13DRAFT_1988542 [Mycena leptocephala]